MTIKDLLVGKKVRATKDCIGAKKGEIYLVEIDEDGNAYIGIHCHCVNTWEILDPIEYKPKPHKHRLVCADCGEDVK